MNLKKILLCFGIDTNTKKIPVRELCQVLIGGGKDSPENICFSNRMLVGNYPRYCLKVGNLVVKGKLEEGSEVYEILPSKRGGREKDIPETEKVTVKAIGKIEFNEIYREATAKRARGELEGLDPPDSKIDLILYNAGEK